MSFKNLFSDFSQILNFNQIRIYVETCVVS